MLVNDAISLLARELRDVDLPYQFTDDDLFSALVDGVDELNAVYHQQFAVSGSGASAVISPEPDSTEKKIWLISSAIIIISGEKVRAAASAFVLSNAGGRTDLTGIPEALGSALGVFRGRLNKFIELAQRQITENQMISREKTRQVTE